MAKFDVEAWLSAKYGGPPPSPILLAARQLGFKPAALAEVARLKKFTVELQDEMVMVRTEGNTVLEAVESYVERELADYLPMLRRDIAAEYLAQKYPTPGELKNRSKKG